MLFKVIRDLKRTGVSIVYISHHLEEALRIADHAVVLRDGRCSVDRRAPDMTIPWIVRKMVGATTSRPRLAGAARVRRGRALDRGRQRARRRRRRPRGQDDCRSSVRAGEIVCIYGLMGAGRTELLECVAGRRPRRPPAGAVLGGGAIVDGLTIAERIAAGIVLVPEDRQRDGLVQTMTVGRNLSLASLGASPAVLFISTAGERGRCLDDDRSAGCTSRPPAPRRRSPRSPAATSRRSSSARCC